MLGVERSSQGSCGMGSGVGKLLKRASLWSLSGLLAVSGLLTVVTLLAQQASALATVETVSGNTYDVGTGKGWLFAFNPTNATPYNFTGFESSNGDGSLYVQPISATPAKKFIADNSILTAVTDLTSLGYDFKIAGSGTAASSNQFYVNVYANIDNSTNFFDCRYDYVATSGSTTDFTTHTINTSDAPVSVTKRGVRIASCPATLNDMPAGSYVRSFALNVGDTTASDTGLAAYLDSVTVTTLSDTVVTYDFEPVPPAAPSNLRLNGLEACGYVTNVNSITPTWDAVPGAVSYNYRVTLPNGSTFGPINVGNVTSVTGPFGSEGLSTFSVQTIDAYGVKSNWATACAVAYDTTAPLVSVTSPDSPNVSGTIGLNGTIIDPNQYSYEWIIRNSSNVIVLSVPVISPTLSTYSWNTSAVTDGMYTIYLKATDRAGNTQTSTAVTVLVDNNKPTAPGTPTPGINPTNTNSVTWTWNPSTDGSGSGISHYDYSTNSGTTWTLNIPFPPITITGYSSATHFLMVRANDNAGNTSLPSANGTVMVDVINPTVAITAPLDGSTVGGGAMVAITATTDDAVSYSLYINDVLTDSGSVPYTNYMWDTTTLTSGDYTLRIEATDLAGNTGTSPNNVVTVDNTAPVITFNGYTLTGNTVTPLISVTGSQSVVWVASVTNPLGAVFNAVLLSTGFTLNADGTYRYTLKAVDTFGNESSYEFTFGYKAPPVSPIVRTPVQPRNLLADIAITDVLGEQNTNNGSDGSAKNPDQDVAGVSDQKDNTPNLFGLAWYWALAIIAAILALGWWLIAAYRRRSQEQ